jgi:hypothetical protein
MIPGIEVNHRVIGWLWQIELVRNQLRHIEVKNGSQDGKDVSSVNSSSFNLRPVNLVVP